ncbi:MAG TPA: dual specificity protein phosphatase family protein [Pyrinomonadaceae bacterium]|nr:dual specificity protein phosphatase family protein [Pyrinomonadaceae bacterium]
MKRTQHGFHSSKGLAAAGFLLMLALTGVITPAQKAVTPPPIQNFGKVNDNYFRGSQPTQGQMATLKAMGVKTIIDLRKDYVPQARQRANELGLNYFNIPLKPSKAATKEQTEYFLSLVNDPANGPVYVHCKGGRHRTGALTAAYRITHDGWTAEQAYDEMKKYDFNDSIFGGPSAQKKFVFDFYKQQR